jgi:predicted AlkP superfamily pyrophosphatase or phosphodiesterase
MIGGRAEARADSAKPGADASSVLLVTFDTVRADRIGAYGYSPAITPTLDRLATRGILFESAVSATPTTLPSHASILTGTYPSAHGVHDNGVFALERDAMLISEVFEGKRQVLRWPVGKDAELVLQARSNLDDAAFEEAMRGMLKIQW